jgi:hypothetical protein
MYSFYLVICAQLVVCVQISSAVHDNLTFDVLFAEPRRGLAHTLRPVRSLVIWVVVELAEVLQGTSVMYRHMFFRPEINFTTAVAKAHVTEFRQIG